MANSSDWASGVPVIAGALAIVSVYLLKARKSPSGPPPPNAAESSRFDDIEVKPARWYHHLLVAGLVALPLVQAGAYDQFPSNMAIFFPLGVFLSFALPTAMFLPRAINRAPLDVRQPLLFLAVLAAGALIAFQLP